MKLSALWITGMLWMFGALTQAADMVATDIIDSTPTIERKPVVLPTVDRRDLALGVWSGFISIEDFGVNSISGARIAYQVSESLFFESRYAQSKAGESSFETISDIQLLTDEDRKLKFYDLGIGYRIAGQSFITRKRTLTSNFYLVGSMGNTQFAGSDELTTTFGAGFNVLLNDWLQLSLEGREHLWSSDVLGTEKNTQNLVFSVGVSTFF